MKLIAGLLTAILLWVMCILPASAQTTSTDSSPARHEPSYESGASRFGVRTSIGGNMYRVMEKVWIQIKTIDASGGLQQEAVQCLIVCNKKERR